MRALQPPFLKAVVRIVRAGQDELLMMRAVVRQSLFGGIFFTAIAIIMAALNTWRPPKDVTGWFIVGVEILFAGVQWANFFVWRRRLTKRVVS